MKEMNTVNTTETTVATTSETIYFLDMYGFMHSTREEALEANRG